MSYQVTLTPSKDAWVNSGAPTTNYGTSSLLSLGYSGRQLFLDFDFNSVAGKKITAATLRFYVTPTVATVKPELYRADADWTETGITWNNKPGYTGTKIGETTAWSSEGWKSATLTVAQLILAINAGFGFACIPVGSGIANAWSREGTVPPELILTLESSQKAVCIVKHT